MPRRPQRAVVRSRPRRATMEFCVPGEPVSARTTDRSRLVAWCHRVRDVAAAHWSPDRTPLDVAVELRITHYGERQAIDLDNMIKPIQDALQGIVYRNDRQVREVTGRWRSIDGHYPLRYISRRLSAAFSRGDEFVHVEVWLAREGGEMG